MNSLVLMIVLAAPFIILGSIIASLIVTIGKAQRS